MKIVGNAARAVARAARAGFGLGERRPGPGEHDAWGRYREEVQSHARRTAGARRVDAAARAQRPVQVRKDGKRVPMNWVPLFGGPELLAIEGRCGHTPRECPLLYERGLAGCYDCPLKYRRRPLDRHEHFKFM